MRIWAGKWTLPLVVVASLALAVACSSDDGGDGGGSSSGGSSSGASSSGGSSSGASSSGSSSSGGGATDEVTADDVVDLDDLLGDPGDAAGAVKIGQPAQTLTAVAKALKDQRNLIKAVIDRVKDTVAKAQPDAKGKTTAGQPFGVWKGEKNGLKYRFIAVRTAVKRLRYTLYGSEDGKTWKGLLTGLFVKAAPKKGGGRLHLNLSHMTDLVPALNLDGRVHVWFANAGKIAKARRVVYRKVKKRNKQVGPAWNFGADYVRKIGTGGGARTLVVGDLNEDPTTVEAFAARVGWLAGKGGRGVAVYGQVHPAKKVFAVVKECWGPIGKNKWVQAVWKDPKANKGGWTDGGDAKHCVGDDPGDPPDSALDPDKSDADPDAEAAFKSDGAADLDEKAADEADPASLGD